MNGVHTGYLGAVFNRKQFQNALELAEATLKDKSFDAFAVRGHSGCLFGGALAARMNKILILVRKHADDAHCRMNIEGDATGLTYVFLDDLECSGKTRRKVRETIHHTKAFSH